LTISNNSNFKCTSWLNGLFFSSGDYDILKEEVNAYQIVQSSLLNSTTVFFPTCTSIVYECSYLSGDVRVLATAVRLLLDRPALERSSEEDVA
jgi:hypothetical protein